MSKFDNVKDLANLAEVFGDIDNAGGRLFSDFLFAWKAATEKNIETMKSFDTYLP